MSRNDDPSSVSSGHGRALEKSIEPSALTFPLSDIGGVGSALEAHINDPTDAHNASAISTEEERILAGVNPLYDGDDVQEALDQLASLFPRGPAQIGVADPTTTNTGIPYWGALNINDPPKNTHPEYRPTTIFGGTGVETSTYPYNGTPQVAKSKVGGFTRGGDVIETYGIIDSGVGAIILDCFVAPADRGVIALVHFEAGGGLPAAPADRVIAACLLGGGIAASAAIRVLLVPGDGNTITFNFSTVGGPASVVLTARAAPSLPNEYLIGVSTTATATNIAAALNLATNGFSTFLSAAVPLPPTASTVLLHSVASGVHGAGITIVTSVPATFEVDPNFIGGALDGEPGGMFQEENPEDFFGFPGRGSGQYNLNEIHTGTNSFGTGVITKNASAGATRQEAVQGYLRLGAVTAYNGSGPSNFIGYRLPYLQSYDLGLFGLAMEGHSSEEPRYFADQDGGGGLASAGAYDGYSDNFFSHQIARFRQTIKLPGVTYDYGSIVLMHFRTEAAFEALVLSGTLPTQASLYSLIPTLTGGDVAEDVANLTVPTIRRALFVDDGASPPAAVSGAFDNPGGATTLVQVSGVSYYASGLFVSDIVGPFPFGVETADLFSDAYRTGDVVAGGEVTANFENAVPLQLNVRHFGDAGDGAATGLKVTPVNTGANGITAAGIAPFSYAQFADTVFNLAAPPAIGATATQVTINIQRFAIHVGSPIFMERATVRAWMRDPLAENAFPGTDLIFMGDSGAGSGDVGLMVNFDADFGTETAPKDAVEYFSDEAYRIDADFAASISLSANERASLLGPGIMGTGGHSGAPVALHVRVATEDAALAFDPTASLGAGGNANELQVRGLPDWFPSTAPPTPYVVPHGGCLTYPDVNYTPVPPAANSYRPHNTFFAEVAATHPDYSALVGNRVYVRAFDAKVNGKSLLTLTIVGCNLADFAFEAPGPGDVTATGLSIQFKLPGTTVWMDAGRPDGEGSSKQHPFLDGAGCLVMDEDTGDLPSGDPDGTGLKACQIKINVGPAAGTYPVAEGMGVATRYPLLMKVGMRDPAGVFVTPNLRQGGEPVTTPGTVTGIKSIKLLV